MSSSWKGRRLENINELGGGKEKMIVFKAVQMLAFFFVEQSRRH